MHFNNNLHRETRKKSDESHQVAVTYPKFKNGKATVRDIKIKPNFGKQTFVVQKYSIASSNAPAAYFKVSFTYMWQIIFMLEGYVHEVWETLLGAMKKKDILENEKKMIKEITPAPMNTMLTKEPRGEAIKKREERKKMITKDVPPTAGKIFSCKHKVYVVNEIILFFSVSC